MSNSVPSPEDIRHSVRHTVQLHWGLFLSQGIVMTLLGMLAIVWPQVSTMAADVYVGVLFLLAGGMGFGLMFLAPTVSGFLWSLVTAALALITGILLLWHPVAGAVSLTLVLVAFFIAEGLFQTVIAFGSRTAFPQSWGWMLVSGIADLVLAGLIIAGWPGSAAWAIGLIVGVNLISSGVAITMTALAVRPVVKFAEKALR